MLGLVVKLEMNVTLLLNYFLEKHDIFNFNVVAFCFYNW